jgi:hypothetical protein
LISQQLAAQRYEKSRRGFPRRLLSLAEGSSTNDTAAIQSAYAKRPPFPAAVFYEQTSC